MSENVEQVVTKLDRAKALLESNKKTLIAGTLLAIAGATVIEAMRQGAPEDIEIPLNSNGKVNAK